MSGWKVLYRDQLDQDRISERVSSKEAALEKARNLYYRERAEIYKIEGPDGRTLLKQEIINSASDYKW